MIVCCSKCQDALRTTMFRVGDSEPGIPLGPCAGLERCPHFRGEMYKRCVPIREVSSSQYVQALSWDLKMCPY